MADENDKIAEMLDQVATEVTALLKSSNLSKAHPGESTSPEVSPDASATSPAPEASASPAEGSPPTDAPAEGSPSPEASASPEGSASASGTPSEGSASPGEEGSASASGDPAAEGDGSDGPVDPMALAEEYGKLSMPDLLTHYQAIKHVLAEKMPPPAPEQTAPPVSAAPPAAASPPPEATPPAADPMMGKSETTVVAPETEALKAELAASQEAVGYLVKAVEQALARPLRKAVTSLSDVTPPKATEQSVDNISSDEITRRLRRAASNPKLAKSDRDLINQYCFKKADLNQIKHLLGV